MRDEADDDTPPFVPDVAGAASISDLVRGVARRSGVDLPPVDVRHLRRVPPPADYTLEQRRIEARQYALDSVPEDFKGASLHDPKIARLVDRRALLAARKLTDADRMVTLFGPSGAGKTTLAVALFHARLAAEPWPSGFFVQAPSLYLEQRETGLGEAAPLLTRARRARVLVLDDLGEEGNAREWSVALRELLMTRHARRQHTIVTTMLRSQDEALDRYGEGPPRRLFERCAIPFAAPEKRVGT